MSFTVIIWIFRYMAPQLGRLICGLAWGGWSRREVCFHSGGEMVSTSSKLPLNLPLSLWPTNRSVDKQWESGTMSSVLLSVYLTRGRKSSNCMGKKKNSPLYCVLLKYFIACGFPSSCSSLFLLQIKWLIRGNKEGGSLRVQERFIAGSLAGATAQTIIYPMEVSLKFVSVTSSWRYVSFR